jgi:dTMP kinase
MSGKFIVIEGIDGSGKTTLCKALLERFESLNVPAVQFCEPTHFETGKYIRKFLRKEISLNSFEQLLAFLEDRKQSVQRNILPALEKSNIVILDRYIYSTAAYQSNSIHSPEEILQKNLDESFPIPDYLFYLDIKPEDAWERIQKRGISTEFFDTISNLEKIYSAYQKVLPEHTIYLDANLTTEELCRIVLEKLALL